MAILAPLLVVIAAVIAVIVYLDNPKRRAAGLNLPPVYSYLFPVFGNMVEFGKNPVAVLKDAHQKLGDCFTLHIASFNMTYLIGPEAQTVFFKATDEELSQREAYKFVTPVFGPGVVFDSPISVFYEQMKFIKSGLAANNLKKYVPTIEREARTFFDKWGNSGEIDMLAEMNRLTILTASTCLLGEEIRKDPKVINEFADLYHDLEGGLNPIAFFFPNFPMSKHWTRDRARVKISELFMRLIKERRSLPETERRDDMLQILLESAYKEGGALDDTNITGLLIALLFAGQHTSGITSSWTGFFLVKYPQFMKEVIEEQKEIIAEHGHEINWETLRKSVKLENCIREALRLFPPLIILMRKAKVPIQYKDITIPAGDFVCVSPAYAMRLPEMYTNPNEYDPHRFDRGEDKQLPYAYISFGGGRHGCPGENFGITQIKTVWTVLLRNYEFEFGTQGMPVPDYTTLVVGPTQPAWLRYKKRATPL